MRRQDLSKHFGTFGLRNPGTAQRAPTLTKGVVERLRAYGIKTRHKSGYVIFSRRKPKTNPQV